MLQSFFKAIRFFAYLLMGIPFIILAFSAGCIGRKIGRDPKRVIFGSSPLISNIYWCNSLNANGRRAETWMTNGVSLLPERSFSVNFSERYGKRAPMMMAFYFLKVLVQPAIVVTTCEGFLLGQSIFWKIEAPLLKLSGCPTVVIPFGGDSYSYRRISSPMLQQAIQFSYPLAARKQRSIEKRSDYWTKQADIFIPGVMYQDGFGRADILTPSPFCIDTELWTASARASGYCTPQMLTITHTPNHQGFKGTEFLIDAVTRLKHLGHNVELKLIENKSNTEVREIITRDADIHVDQLIADGYAFSAIEGMSAGIPVVANLTRDHFTLPLRTWSFLAECPIVSANSESVFSVLLNLVTNTNLREEIGGKSREYVLKYHSYSTFARLFDAVDDEIISKSGDLRYFYVPEKKEN